MAADYEVALSLTDSESFMFSAILVDDDGEPLDMTGLSFEYILWGCGENVRLDETNGLTINLDTGIIDVALPAEQRLRCGTYQHGFRSTDENAKTVQLFDGEVSVTKGGF